MNLKTIADDFSSWFWGILEEVKGDEDALSEKLLLMSREEMIQFYREFTEAAADLQCPPFTDRLQGQSEDGIADITEYVVSLGQEFYSSVLNNPDQIPTAPPPNGPSFKGTALNVFWERFGESIPR